MSLAELLVSRRLDFESQFPEKRYKEPVELISDLPDLPSDWYWATLDQVCSKIQDGTHHSPNNQFQEGGEGRYLYITAKNVRNWGIDYATATFVDQDVQNEIWARCDPKPGDVLLTKDGTIGNCTHLVPNRPFSLLSSVAQLRPVQSHILAEYLSLFLKSPVGQQNILKRVGGTALKRTTLTKLRPTEIPVPPIDIQEEIISKLNLGLSTCSEFSNISEHIGVELDLLMSSILKAACEGRLVPNEAELARKEERDYEPADQLLERILSERRARFEAENPRKKYIEPIHPNTTDLPNLPEGWCWSTVGECFEFIAGVGFPKAIQGTHGEAIPLFKVGSISAVYQAGEKYLFDSENTVSSEIAIQLSKKLVPSGTIVFAKIGAAIGLNRRAVTAIECLIDNNTAGLFPHKGLIDDEFAFSFMNTVRLMDYARATTVPSVRKYDICAIPFPLPPYAEQIRISAKLIELVNRSNDSSGLIQQCDIQSKLLWQSILLSSFSGNNRK